MTRMRDTFPRSVTSLAARPVTLAAHADITTLAGEVVDPTRRSKRRNALPSRHRAPDPVVPSTVLRSLIGPLDGVAAEADIAEERAVREAWAAAQDEIESSAENKDVLRAIDDAERGMRLSPATPAQSAMDVALDEELLGHAEAKSSGSHPIDAPDLLNRPKHPSRDE